MLLELVVELAIDGGMVVVEVLENESRTRVFVGRIRAQYGIRMSHPPR